MRREATGAKIDWNLRLYKYSRTPLSNTARRSQPFTAFFKSLQITNCLLSSFASNTFLLVYFQVPPHQEKIHKNKQQITSKYFNIVHNE